MELDYRCHAQVLRRPPAQQIPGYDERQARLFSQEEVGDAKEWIQRQACDFLSLAQQQVALAPAAG